MPDPQISPDINSLMSGALGDQNSAYAQLKNDSSSRPGTNTGPARAEMQKADQATNQMEKVQYPQGPHAPQLAPPPPLPKDDPLSVFQQFGPVLALLGSFAVKGPNSSAIDSATAAINAYHSGNEESYKKARQKWEDDNKTMMDQYRLNHEQFEDDWKRSDGDINKFAAIRTARAAAVGNQLELSRIAAGDHDAMMKDHELLFNASNKIVDAMEKFKKDEALAARGSPSMSQDAIDFKADQYLSEGKAALANLGRGTQGAANINAIMERVTEKAKEKGKTGADMANIDADFAGLQAESRAIGSRTGAIKIASEAVGGAADMALAASAKIDRSQYPSLNAIYESALKGTGDTAIVDFMVKHNTLINEYATAQNPKGAPRIADKEHARDILSAAYNKGQYEAGVNAIKQEVANIKKSVATVATVAGDKSAKGVFNDGGSKDYPLPMPADYKFEKGKYYDTPGGVGKFTGIEGGKAHFE